MNYRYVLGLFYLCLVPFLFQGCATVQTSEARAATVSAESTAHESGAASLEESSDRGIAEAERGETEIDKNLDQKEKVAQASLKVVKMDAKSVKKLADKGKSDAEELLKKTKKAGFGIMSGAD